MKIDEFIERFEEKMNVEEKLVQHSEINGLTAVSFYLGDGVSVSLTINDDNEEFAAFSIEVGNEIILLDAKPLDELINCFGKD